MLYQAFNSVGSGVFRKDLYRDFQFIPHLHRHPELTAVLEGELTVTVEGRREKMKAGGLALILPNQIHAYETQSHSLAWVGVFSEDWVHAFIRETENLCGEQSVFRCREELWGFLSRELFSAEPSANPEDRYLLKSCLYAVCSEYRRLVKLVDRPPLDGSLLHKILQCIDSRFREGITLTSMAAELGYEPHYLSRYFNSALHMSFPAFLNQYRVNAAVELLAREGKNVTEAAFESGFQSIRTFNRVFKEITGAEPRLYLRAVSGQGTRAGAESPGR